MTGKATAEPYGSTELHHTSSETLSKEKSDKKKTTLQKPQYKSDWEPPMGLSQKKKWSKPDL